MGKFKQAMHTVATKLSMPIINALSIKEQKRWFMEKDSKGRTALHEIALNPGQAASSGIKGRCRSSC
jgi:hypothetical protein